MYQGNFERSKHCSLISNDLYDVEQRVHPLRHSELTQDGGSSEPSPQSSSLSHFQAFGMHLWLLHRNSSAVQLRAGFSVKKKKTISN